MALDSITTTSGTVDRTSAYNNQVGAPSLKTDPDKYISLGDLLDPNKPDNRDLLISQYGDQGITGFLTLTGAVNNAGTADEVTWWEEGRLHKVFNGTYDADGKATLGVGLLTGVTTTDGHQTLRKNDVVLTSTGLRLIVLNETAADGSNADKYDVVSMDGTAGSDIGTAEDMAIIGNIYAQGTDQPSKFFHPTVQKFVNPYIITKETYAVNGSQATNIGWVNVGNGDYRWYVKGEMDTRKRFMNQREMMLLFGESKVNVDGSSNFGDGTGDTAVNPATDFVTGSEGYFQAVDRRGITATLSGGAQGSFASMSDIDSIILELDKEGAPAEYAMYVNRATSLDIDDLLANGIATQVTAGLPGQFGAFNNDADMAVKLGFKSFTRGGYTFHKHDWKLLNDPTLGGISDIKGAMVPLANVADARSGAKAPALQMNYKGTNGYNRDMEHWVSGSIMGYNNMTKDVAEFYYRSECNLCVRAANQHVVLK